MLMSRIRANEQRLSTNAMLSADENGRAVAGGSHAAIDDSGGFSESEPSAIGQRPVLAPLAK